MFIAQVMYAEGLVKVLKAILYIKKNQHHQSIVQRELKGVEAAKAVLENMCPTASVLGPMNQQLSILRQKHAEYASSLALLEKCGVKSEEYEEKFRLISSDCARISHGSVKPPEWQTA
ncbi:MAG: hypothetical protein Q8Q06_01610 [bacterium]|nr:hypothetical protein [bacterium]